MDISVRGAGILGLSIAWRCVQAGARVELVDPHGVAAAASGGIVGALAPHVPENWNDKKQFQLDSLLMAPAFWAEVAETGGGDPGYARLGRVQPLAEAGVDLARSRAVGAEAVWSDNARWKVTDAAQGWDVPSPSGFYVFDTLSAHIHPRRACDAVAAALGARGWHVVTDATASPAKIVWATGVTGLEALNEGARRPMGQGIKGQAALLRLDRTGLPQLFTDTLHIIPHLDGTVAIGSTTEREFENANETDALLEEVLARARAAVPELAGADVIQRWAGLRPRARSRAPMLGDWPDHPEHYVANGGFKIGLGMAPKIAEVMTQLLLEDVDNIPQSFRVEASL